MSNGELAPTARLRWVERAEASPEFGEGVTRPAKVLQCWWAPDVAGYMRDPNVGEWRDVPEGVEAP